MFQTNDSRPASNFLTNPRSEAESRRKKLHDDYKKEVQKQIEERNKRENKRRTIVVQQPYEQIQPEKIQSPVQRDPFSFRFDFFNEFQGDQVKFQMPPVRYQPVLVKYQPRYQPQHPKYLQSYSPHLQTQTRPTRSPPVKSREPQEYFPFGRPGAGAPFRDQDGQILAQRSGKFTNFGHTVVQTSVNPHTKPSANWTFNQQHELKLKQQEDWRKALEEQLNEKQKRLQHAASQKYLQQKQEQEKILNEIKELDRKHRNEIRKERGQPIEEEIVEKEPVKQEKVQERFRQIMVQKPPKPSFSHKFRRLNSPINRGQEFALKDIMNKLIEEADNAQIERNDAYQELNQLKGKLRNQSVPRMERYKHFQSSPRVEKQPDFQQKMQPLHSESSFLPLSAAGQRIMNPAVMNHSKVYNKVSDPKAMQQLETLELLLNGNS